MHGLATIRGEKCGLSTLRWFLAIFLLAARPAAATNGLNVIGFGAESVAMGGADLAVARDTTALNTNPAGLVQIPLRQIDLYGSVAHTLNVRHRDGLGNDRAVSKKLFYGGDFGVATRIGQSPVTIGVGLFGQGGAGMVYHDLITPFGPPDDLSNQFRIARLTPGAAVQINESLSIGASVVVTYADAEQDFFPNTSLYNPAAPQSSFFGFRLQDMDTVATGIKVGAMYRGGERLTFGVAYTSQVDLDLDGGELISNQSDIGLGKVTYSDVRLSGAGQPQELGVGVAVQATEALLVSCELSWLDWSRAAKRSRLRARDPDRLEAQPIVSDTDLDWRDQYVAALGVAYALSDRTLLRAGYNYGRNPIPDETLTPLLPNIAEHHLTAGIGQRLSESWRIDAAIEYQINNRATYTNPDFAFLGPDAREEQEFTALHLMVSRQW